MHKVDTRTLTGISIVFKKFRRSTATNQPSVRTMIWFLVDHSELMVVRQDLNVQVANERAKTREN